MLGPFESAEKPDTDLVIHYGSAKGFLPENRQALRGPGRSIGCLIADFNRDGRLDLAFMAHSLDPGHVAESPIFFNDGHRFQSPVVQYLPAIGPHYMWVQDIGNIYHRRYEENFTSRVFAWTNAVHEGSLVADAMQPFGARVKLQVRNAAHAASVARAAWRVVAAGSFLLTPTDRALQYRLDLLSANGDAYPIVRSVDVRLK